MASFNFNLCKPLAKNTKGEKRINPDKTRVYLVIIEDRANRARIKTEFNVKPIQWDFKKQRIKHQVPGSVPINSKLDELIQNVTNEYYRIRKDFPSMKFPEITDNLKVFIKEKLSPVYNDKSKTFFNVFEQYITMKGEDVSELTIKKYKTLKKSLLDFDPGITFDKIDLTFYDRYVHYLRTRKPKGRQKTRAEEHQTGLLNDTIAKYIENLKNFLKWSYEREYHTNNIYQHTSFKAERKAKNDIVTLQLDELRKIYEFDLSDKPRLERVRDVFCFGCFTGQRWSDIERFNKNDITGTLWKFESFKTKKLIIVPLVGYAAPTLEILRKYEYNLPIISPQKFNKYLKDAAELAGLDRRVKLKRFIGKQEIIFDEPLHKLITSHTARRTAVSLLLNVENMPIYKVREITGHSDLKTLDKYLDRDPEALAESMGQTKGITSPLRVVKNDAI